MLTQDEAIEAAKKEFTLHGYVASDYDAIIETYPDDENQWIVWFDGKGPFRTPGGKHAVLVDKETGQTVFMHGE